MGVPVYRVVLDKLSFFTGPDVGYYKKQCRHTTCIKIQSPVSSSIGFYLLQINILYNHGA